MAEVGADIKETRSGGILGRLKQALGSKSQSPEVSEASEAETRLKALDTYIKRLKEDKYLRGTAVMNPGGDLQDKLRSLKFDFEGEKRTNPQLKAEAFLQQKSYKYENWMFIKSSGWERPALDTTHNRPQPNQDFSWDTTVIGKLVGEERPVDLDTKFSKSSFDDRLDKSAAFYPKSGGWSETSYSRWVAANQNPQEKAAGISVILIREDEKPKDKDRSYFTGQPGGVRGFALSISDKTLAAYLESETSIHIGG